LRVTSFQSFGTIPSDQFKIGEMVSPVNEKSEIISPFGPPGTSPWRVFASGVAMARIDRPQAYARPVDGKVELVIWRRGRRFVLPILLDDPLCLATDLVAAYRETIAGQPDPVRPYARAAGAHPTRSED
jgi:hypothetical protein